MDKIFFKPWIGKSYGTNLSLFNKKILIVGDSHYCEDNCSDCGDKKHSARCSDFTEETISAYLGQTDSAAWTKTFTKFMNSLVIDKVDYDRQTAWNSVCFYNFLQIAAGDTPRKTAEYSYSNQTHLVAFIQVLNHLKPDIIITWGNKVWDSLPINFGYGEATPDSIFPQIYYHYPFENKTISLIGVTHPSSAYTSDDFNKIFTQLKINA